MLPARERLNGPWILSRGGDEESGHVGLSQPAFSLTSAPTHQHCQPQAEAEVVGPAGAPDWLCPQRRLLPHQQKGEGQISRRVSCDGTGAGGDGHPGIRSVPGSLSPWQRWRRPGGPISTWGRIVPDCLFPWQKWRRPSRAHLASPHPGQVIPTSLFPWRRWRHPSWASLTGGRDCHLAEVEIPQPGPSRLSPPRAESSPVACSPCRLGEWVGASVM